MQDCLDSNGVCVQITSTEAGCVCPDGFELDLTDHVTCDGKHDIVYNYFQVRNATLIINLSCRLAVSRKLQRMYKDEHS